MNSTSFRMRSMLFICVMQLASAVPAYAMAFAPSIAAVNPASGGTGGGDTVTINGMNFVSGATVTFGGAEATNVVFVSPSQLTCATPPQASGAVSVAVTNPDSQNSTLPNGFTYGGSVSVLLAAPNHGTTNGGTAVEIDGANFANGATVTFGGAMASNVMLVSAAKLTCTAPAHTGGGAVSVVVANSAANSGALNNGYFYSVAPAPVVTRIAPNNGTTNGGTAVTIVGANFAAGAIVTFGGVAVKNAIFVNPRQLTCTTPAILPATTAVNVAVINPDLQTSTLSDGYTYMLVPAPIISSMAPNKGLTNGGATVRIRGANFARGATVSFGGTASPTVTFISPIRLTCTVPTIGPAASVVSVTVTNPDNESSILSNGFAYILARRPAIASVTPDTGPATGGTAVTIMGAHFVAASTVTFGVVAAQGLTFINSAQLSCTTPASSSGPVAVTVTNPDTQSGSLRNGFIYGAAAPAPTAANLSPNSATILGGVVVSINGANFVSGAHVLFGSAPATNVTFVSSTQLTCTTPANALGAVAVVVTNPDGQSGTLNNGFTYVPLP